MPKEIGGLEIFDDASIYRDQSLGPVRRYMDGNVFESRRRSLLSEHHIVEAAKADDLPLPPTAERENYYDDRHYEYWLSGRRDMDIAVSSISNRSETPEEPVVFEIGCATGRVLRHAEASLGRPCRMIGSDVNERYVGWVNYHLGPRIMAMRTGYQPPLPMADSSVYLFLAFSVFTHIYEYEEAWLFEIYRLLQSGGYFYVTIHDEGTIEQIEKTPFAAVVETPEFIEYLKQSPALKSRMQITWLRRDGVRICDVFHPISYIKSVWGNLFDIVDIKPQVHDHQTGVLLRKR